MLSAGRILSRLAPRGARSVYSGTPEHVIDAEWKQMHEHIFGGKTTLKDLLDHAQHSTKKPAEHIHIDIHQEKVSGNISVSSDIHVDIHQHETHLPSKPKRHR